MTRRIEPFDMDMSKPASVPVDIARDFSYLDIMDGVPSLEWIEQANAARKNPPVAAYKAVVSIAQPVRHRARRSYANAFLWLGFWAAFAGLVVIAGLVIVRWWVS
jgi:hypothetical protein